MEYLNTVLLQIYHCVCQRKNFENRLIFGEATGKSLVSCFFLTHSTDLCSRTDDWSHRKMCDPLGIRSAGFGRRQLPEVRRFAGSTSSGAWRDTLGMSSVHDNAAASTRALSQVAFSMYWCTSAVQVGLMYHYLCMPSGQAPYLVSKNGRLAIKGCCTWLDCASTQL